MVITTLVLFGCLFYGAVSFQLAFHTNDDAGMLGISLGLFSDGIGDPRLIYQSAFLGSIIGGLFRLAPGFDWYSAMQWLFCLGAFWVIGFSLLRRDPGLLGIGSFVTVASIFCAPILFQIQFTQTSIVCIVASAVVLLDNVSRPQWSRGAVALALSFAVIAALVRSVNLITAQLVFIFIAVCIGLYWLSKGQRRLALIRFALVLVFTGVLTAIVTGLQHAESALFYAQADWREFRLKYTDRAFVLDNAIKRLGHDRVSAALESNLGITPEQLDAMNLWLPINKSIYSLESFSEMARVVREIESTDALTTKSVGDVLRFIRNHPIFMHSMILIVIISVLRVIERPKTGWKVLAVGIAWIAFAVVLLFGIAQNYRLPPYRVWMPLAMLSVFITLACHAVIAADTRFAETHNTEHGPDALRGRRLTAVLIIGIVVGLGWLAPLHLDFRKFLDERDETSAHRCNATESHVQAFRNLPEGASIFLASQLVHSQCYLKPFRPTFPSVLAERTTFFGWRNLTPWIREDLFKERDELFDIICANPDNMFVMHAIHMPKLERYLQRHNPGTALTRYADDLPHTIRACRRDAQPAPGS